MTDFSTHEEGIEDHRASVFTLAVIGAAIGLAIADSAGGGVPGWAGFAIGFATVYLVVSLSILFGRFVEWRRERFYLKKDTQVQFPLKNRGVLVLERGGLLGFFSVLL